MPISDRLAWPIRRKEKFVDIPRARVSFIPTREELGMPGDASPAIAEEQVAQSLHRRTESQTGPVRVAQHLVWRRREGTGDSRSPVHRPTSPSRQTRTRTTQQGPQAPVRHGRRTAGRSMDRRSPRLGANRLSRPRYPGNPVSLLQPPCRPLSEMSKHLPTQLDPTCGSWPVPVSALRERFDADRGRPRPDLPVLG